MSEHDIEEPRCSIRRCIHFQGVKQPNDDEETEIVYCTAFPDGIPNEIAYGSNLHLKPVEGDHGIQFVRNENAPRDPDDDTP